MKKNILLLSFLAYIAFFQNANGGEFTGAGIKLRQILESSLLHYDDLVVQGYHFLIKKEYENNDSLDLSKIRWFVLNNNLISINDVLSFKFSNGSILNMRYEGHELSTTYFSELSSLRLQNKKIYYNEIKVLIVK